MKIGFDYNYNKPRYIAYFDLLGTKRMVENGNFIEVFYNYQTSIETATETPFESEYIDVLWFSDTILFIGKDDSEESLGAVLQCSKWFFYFMITSAIPLRGAITIGDLYYDKNSNIFLGEALVNAYQEAENQNWIGLILTEKIESELSKRGLFYYCREYEPAEVEYKEKTKYLYKKRYAVVFSRIIVVNNEVHAIEVIKKMSENIVEHDIKRKYQNTMKFQSSIPVETI